MEENKIKSSVEKTKNNKANKPKHYMTKINQKKIEFRIINANKNERITKKKSKVYYLLKPKPHKNKKRKN